MLTKDKQDMIYDAIVTDMVTFTDHVILTDLKSLLYDLANGDEDWCGNDPEEMEDAIHTLISWYGVPGQDFG